MYEKFLREYEKARNEKDWENVTRIEREAASKGMDKMTLNILLAERRKEKAKKR